jgi:phage terminase large subunit-like protein
MTRGERVCAFIEAYCRVPEGALVGKLMKLEPFQRKFICDVYDNPHRTRRAYLSIARKNGKTGLIAGILLAHVAGPEARLNAQIVSGAQSRDQASLVFSLAAKMVQLSPELSKIVRIVPSGKKLIGLTRNTEFRALSAEGKTAHGLSPVLAILDEVGQVRGPRDDFVDAIITSQGAHEDPLLIAISTQAPNDADLFSIWLDDAVTSKDKRIVSHNYQAPKDCGLMDEAAWKIANPAIGKFRSAEDVREQAERALRMPSAEPTFRNLVLNQRVEIVSPFVASGVWMLNSGEVDDSAFYDSPVWAGLDLSGRADLTALVMVAWKEGKWHIRSTFWTPEKGLIERSRRDRAPYDTWHQQGLIRTTPGASIDYEHVARDIGEVLTDCDVRAVAFDRWRFDVLKKEFDDIGLTLPMVPFGQGFKDMAPALDALESALLNEQMAHGDDPVLRMCAANSRVERDAAGNRKLSKGKATGRIDGMVALAMAMGVAQAPVEAPATPQLFFI